MDVDFIWCCDFLARVIEKYGPEIRDENIKCAVLSKLEFWEPRQVKQEDILFRYLESIAIYL